MACLVEDVAAELHDRDHAAIELEPERRERDRLHVAHDLLRVLALMRDDVHFGDATVGLGDEPNDRHVGQPTDLPLDFRQIQFVHVSFFPVGRAATLGRGGAAMCDHRGARGFRTRPIRRWVARSTRGPRRRVRESRRSAASASSVPWPWSPAPRWCRRGRRVSSATAASRSATRKAARHMPSVFAARGPVSTHARRSEPDEHDQHVAAAGRAQHDLVHRDRAVDAQVSAIGILARVPRDLTEPERTVEGARAVEVGAGDRDERHRRPDRASTSSIAVPSGSSTSTRRISPPSASAWLNGSLHARPPRARTRASVASRSGTRRPSRWNPVSSQPARAASPTGGGSCHSRRSIAPPS